MVVVDVDDFHDILVRQGVWQRPAHARRFREVDGALVVAVVQFHVRNGVILTILL